MKKIFLVFNIFYISKFFIALIEVDITRGNLDPFQLLFHLCM